jgi:hypothetical protein
MLGWWFIDGGDSAGQGKEKAAGTAVECTRRFSRQGFANE